MIEWPNNIPDYSRLGPSSSRGESDMSTRSIAPSSGLRTLKRSWSGGENNLQDEEENFVVAPMAKTQKFTSSGQASSSSDPVCLDEDWQSTPPEVQRSVRNTHFHPQDINIVAQNQQGSSSSSSGARVSGLSRSSLARTPSIEALSGRPSSNPMDNGRATKLHKIKEDTMHHGDGIESSSRPSPPQDTPSSSQTTRKIPPGFNFRSTQQLVDERKRSGKAPSWFTQAPDPSSSKAAIPEDEPDYRQQEESVPGMFRLSAQQMYVRDLVVEQRKNVFFTGSAGTGKSVLLRDIIRLLKKRYAKSTDAVAVTASTGIAACNIGGVTLHSFAGIGIGSDDAASMVKKIRRNRKATGRWARTKVLIIDEISMVEPDLLDKLEKAACMLRKSSKPFGGMQVIITGDFFQLPPVMKNAATKFAFEAEMWDRVMEYKVNLTQVFRQKDQTFVRMLNEMRHGKLSQDSIERFMKLSRTPQFDENVVPTNLFPHREDVEKANNGRLMQLKVKGETYTSKDTGTLPADQLEKVLSNFMAPQKLFLKIGAQVMLIKNMDESLVNGSIGKVVAFLDPHEYKMATMRYPNLYDDAHIKQLRQDQQDQKLRESSPSKPAMSSGSGNGNGTPKNGAGDDAKPKTGKNGAPLDPSNIAGIGLPLTPGDLTGPLASALKKGHIGPAAFVRWPLVRFTQPHGGYRTELIVPESWKNELPSGEVQASRIQLPLILAWAMSIHKSQGQTIPCCMIDLGKVFEKGQAYVAISRATCLEGLQVLNFRPEKVMAHPRVIEWSKSLSTSNAPSD
ncbi:unnamed protein product [Sympodiomycopsis kandeliae]